MERTDHREILRFISTVELPYLHNELLHITVNEEQGRRNGRKTRTESLGTMKSLREGFTALSMAGHSKKSNLKCQARLHDALASIGMHIAEEMIAPMDNDECPHGLMYDISSVESDTGYSSTGRYDKDDVQIAEIVNNETKHGYSIVDEKDIRIAGANKEVEI